MVKIRFQRTRRSRVKDVLAAIGVAFGFVLACGALVAYATPARAERVKDLATFQGVRDNPLIGYGLVVGLDGTGDQTTQAPFTTQTLANMLANLGISINNTSSANSTTSPLTNMQLKNVAPLFEDAGVTLIVEPLNILCNHVGYYLDSSYEAFEICNEVGSPNVKVLYDIYHQQISEGNLIPTIRKYFDLIGHFHVADVPGRNEPGTGEINYRNVFKAIEDLGYDKYVGLEYEPTIDTAETIRKVLELCK